MTSGTRQTEIQECVALVCPSRVHARHKLTLPYLGIQWPKVLVNDRTLGIHQESFRRAVNTPVDADAAIGVISRRKVRVAEFLEPANGFRTRVSPVNSINRN